MKHKFTLYSITICAMFAAVVFAAHDARAACGSVPAGGSYTVSSSCTFVGSVNGVDNGGITINSSVTLTINANETVVWGPGFSLVNNGTIVMDTGGAKLQKTRIWMQDNDNSNAGDGYPDSATQTAQTSTPGTGFRNRADLTDHTQIDCLFGNTAGSQNVYRDVSLALDADNDGYYTGSAASQCVGATSTVNTRTYYRIADSTYYIATGDAISSGDVNDSSSTVWQNLNCYSTTDTDGDTHTPNFTESVQAGASCPAGYSSSAGTDCDEACITCYIGSTESTASTDGKDQDCDGNIDERSEPANKSCISGTDYVYHPALTTGCNNYCGTGGGTANCDGGGHMNDSAYGVFNFSTCGWSAWGGTNDSCFMNDNAGASCSCNARYQ